MPVISKQIVVKFLNLVVQGKIDEAYEQYVDMRGKHHNFLLPSGFPALQNAMKENHEEFPNKQLSIKHMICEADLVAAHTHIIPKEGDQGLAAVHLFRLLDHKIIEMWDCGQLIPANSPNHDGPF